MLHANLVRWDPGGPHDSALSALLAVAKTTDAVWDPECEVIGLAFDSGRQVLDALALKVFLALVDSRPVGFGLTKDYVTEREVWIIEQYVLADFRRYGLATRMLRHILHDVATGGARWALMEFDASRERSRALALAAGFFPAGTLVYPSGHSKIEYWIRNIDGA